MSSSRPTCGRHGCPRSTGSGARKVERKRWGGFKHLSGAKYDMAEDPDGEWGDAWYYDDELIYVQKKFVAIPEASTTLDDNGDIVFDRTQMTMTAITYDEMRKGCWDRDERVKDLELNYTDGSLPFPTFPRFCGQTFYEAKDKELALGLREGQQRLDGRGVVRALGRRQHPACIIPLWDVELAAAETKRNAERGVRAIAFSEMPDPAQAARASTPATGTRCGRSATTTASRCACTSGRAARNPIASPDSHTGRGRHPRLQQRHGLAGRLAVLGQPAQFPKLKLAYSEGQIGWIPYILERADTVWEKHDAWTHAKERIPVPPSTQYYGRIFGCFTADRHGLRSLEEVGEDNICFETDYPHTDTTWPHSEAYIEKLCAGLDDDVAYKILRGNAIKMLELDRV